MKTGVATISYGESAEGALNRMRRAGIRHLVVRDRGKIVGIVSDRDIRSLGSLRQVQTVEQVMSSPAVTASPDLSLKQAANLLRGRGIGCLPVVERGTLVGIVTTTDLLELIGQELDGSLTKKGRVPKERRNRPGAKT
jgi:acetoin utilization protein AcuB